MIGWIKPPILKLVMDLRVYLLERINNEIRFVYLEIALIKLLEVLFSRGLENRVSIGERFLIFWSYLDENWSSFGTRTLYFQA